MSKVAIVFLTARRAEARRYNIISPTHRPTLLFSHLTIYVMLRLSFVPGIGRVSNLFYQKMNECSVF